MTVATAEALYGHLRDRFKMSLKGDLAREVYARLHAAGKTDSLAQVMMLFGLVFVTPDLLTQIKLLLVAFLFVLINLIVDMLYVWIDPRVRIYGREA